MTSVPEELDLATLRALFPDPRQAPAHGLVAVGGDYRPEVLLAAYASGIFPWPSSELPYAWFSPDPRPVIVPGDIHVPRSLAKTLRRGTFRTTFDTAFDDVVDACAHVPRAGEDGTWITTELDHGYRSLHRLGFAHSVEVWQDDELVGGLFGVSVGGSFSGDSMFYRRRDASKVALVTLAERLAQWGFAFLDGQVSSQHLVQFGAQEWRRSDFLDGLDEALTQPSRRGPWTTVEPPSGG